MASYSDTPDGLPDHIGALFWDHDAGQLDWTTHRDFMIERILSQGTWQDLRWLRREVSDDILRQTIEQTNGRGLSPKQLRFWQLILNLPSERVDAWLDQKRRQIWDRRAR